MVLTRLDSCKLKCVPGKLLSLRTLLYLFLYLLSTTYPPTYYHYLQTYRRRKITEVGHRALSLPKQFGGFISLFQALEKSSTVIFAKLAPGSKARDRDREQAKSFI